ncbi:PRC-barrel domain-containing protein [Streptomyces sp. HMX112]|uniref:PRC-barrel domain-containing protein n=1 Tax=Streptomyces sp. HMX112 TaxID=3390850 RepID=UPI003A7FB33D
MISPADIREWRDHDVVDPKGHRIGTLEAVYVDTTTDEPAMATVRTGLPTRRRLVFVPLDEAVAGPDYIRISYDRALVRKAPSIGVDDVLEADREAAVFHHYGMTYQPGVNGERQLARR